MTGARIVDLTTERLSEPLGVATARPVLGWRLAPGGHDHRQVAYVAFDLVLASREVVGPARAGGVFCRRLLAGPLAR